MNGKSKGKSVKTSKKPAKSAVKPLALSQRPDATQNLRNAMFRISNSVKPTYKNG